MIIIDTNSIPPFRLIGTIMWKDENIKLTKKIIVTIKIEYVTIKRNSSFLNDFLILSSVISSTFPTILNVIAKLDNKHIDLGAKTQLLYITPN